MNVGVGPGGNGLEPPPRSVQVGDGVGHLQLWAASCLLEKAGAVKQAGVESSRSAAPSSLGTEDGPGAACQRGRRAAWRSRGWISAGSLSHLSAHGRLPTRYLRRSAAPGFVLDQPGLLLGLAEVWLHQWLESSAFSREALIEE